MMGRQNRQMAMILVDIESLMVCKQFYPNIQSESPRPCPAPGDTGVFRERGRATGICRVESKTGKGQSKTELTHKAGASQTMFPPLFPATVPVAGKFVDATKPTCYN